MSALRRHLVAVFAACITLAVGIALGSGPLQRADGRDDTATLEASNSTLEDQLHSARAANVLDAALVKSLAPSLLQNRLTGRAVTVFVLPGVAGPSIAAMRAAIQQAGGSLAVVVTLAADVVDPGKKAYVGSVASSSLHRLDGAGTGSDEAFAQLGLVLARAYVAPPSSQQFDDTAVKIDAELQGAKLVTLDAEPTVRGTAVVVLAPGHHGADAASSARNVITGDLLSTLSPAAEAVVVVTPETGRYPGGLLDILSDTDAVNGLNVATTNAGTSPTGTLVAVYALSGALSGTPGEFGVVDGLPVLPTGLRFAP